MPVEVTVRSPVGPLRILADSYQHDLLKDEDRTAAFVHMVADAVASGGTFADLGAGTGPLAVVAALAGADRVIAVEKNPRRARLAEINLERHAPDDVEYEVLNVDATEEVVNADVIACEMLDTLLLEEDFVDVVNAHVETYGPEVVPGRVHVGAEPADRARPYPYYEPKDPDDADVLEVLDANRGIPKEFEYRTPWRATAFHTWIEWDGRRVGGSDVFCPALVVPNDGRPVVGVRGGGLETLRVVVSPSRTR